MAFSVLITYFVPMKSGKIGHGTSGYNFVRTVATVISISPEKVCIIYRFGSGSMWFLRQLSSLIIPVRMLFVAVSGVGSNICFFPLCLLN